ncbi:unnamed protein product [Parascedosporium putredinis]|uniref:Glycosyltransferase family 32 protein n=1 Tax=Parascedosporium putredinis TaxID=1442378 RepID=A0A9P1MGE5_9PEZI|nr:unnamed protein product [Parascedosporium putredinis]CAI8004284.1 unnamed protein product [Parascedosporium putredinis]
MFNRTLLRYGKLAVGFATAVFLVLFFHYANFEAYGFGEPASALEVTLHPGAPPAPNAWGGVEGTHPARFRNDSYDPDIPHIVHFVYLLQDGVRDFKFEFKEALAVYSAAVFTDPDVIYLHTNADDAAIERARSGQLGKWNSVILNAPQLVTRRHKSDFVRVAALEEFGGIYLDVDAIPLRDLRPLLSKGYNAVVGKQADDDIMSGNFIGKAHCAFFTQWKEQMHQVFNQEWIRHSNHLMAELAGPLSKLDHEILVLDYHAMGPIHWNGFGTQALYRVHYDVESNLEGLSDGAPLKAFDDNSGALREGFRRGKRIIRIPGSSTPGVKSGTSSYPKASVTAVYHIAKHMYDRGFFSFDDPWRYSVAEV